MAVLDQLSQSGKTELSQGYRILLGCFLLLFIMSGISFYAFAVFFKPIQRDFDWGREVISAAFIIFYLVQAISAPFVGRFVDRYGPKKIITLGGLISSTGLALLSLTTNLPYFYMGYGIMSLGCSSIGIIPVNHIVSDWFKNRRGTALGITSSGLGIGGFVFPLIVGIYLIPNLGWRTTYQILAVSSLLFIILIVQLMIKIGPNIDEPHTGVTEESEETASSSRSFGAWTLNQILKTSTFWLITCAFVLFNLSQVGMTQHLVNHLTDIGFPVATATAIFSLTSLTTAAGKLFFGHISDRFRIQYCTVLSFLCGLIATVVLLVLDSTSSLLLICLYILSMGLAVGGWAPLSSMLISTNFGVEYYGTVFGAFSVFFYLGTGISPVFFGYVYDTTHQYYLAYVSALVFFSVAIALMLILRRPKQPTVTSTKSRE